jgi:hypothetical protein
MMMHRGRFDPRKVMCLANGSTGEGEGEVNVNVVES